MEVIGMKKVLGLIITVLIICSSTGIASAKAVKKPVNRDVFLYEYFSKTLVRFEYSLRYSIQGNPYGVQLAETTTKELKEIQLEALYYRNRGVNTRVMEVIPPFYDFSRNLEELAELVLRFQKERNSTALAAGIRRTVEVMNRDLEAIDSMRLMNGTKVLSFTSKTAGLRSYLATVIKMTGSTEVRPSKFEIYVSNMNPVLYDNVTIYGSTPLNGSVKIVIARNNSLVILPTSPEKGMFSVVYSFGELGNYSVYAIQGDNRSNTIEVRVRKIPSLFLMNGVFSGLMGSTLNVSGQLLDYYGKALGNREISIGNTTLLTDAEGRFCMNYTSSSPETVQLTVSFRGDEVHSAASKTVSLVFTKYPTSITLSGPPQGYVGRKVRFTGNITPPLSAQLTVYLNGIPYTNVTSVDGGFSFSLKPNETGKLEVYVKFPGNDMHTSAVSNVVVLSVVKPASRTPRYAVMLLILVLLASIFVYTRRGGETEARKDKTELPKPSTGKETVLKLPEGIPELYAFLRKKLGVDENLTPREALAIFRNTEIYEDMKRITELHEKLVYGSMPLTGEEEREIRERARKVLGGYE
jgi:hypothetical protein